MTSINFAARAGTAQGIVNIGSTKEHAIRYQRELYNDEIAQRYQPTQWPTIAAKFKKFLQQVTSREESIADEIKTVKDKIDEFDWKEQDDIIQAQRRLQEERLKQMSKNEMVAEINRDSVPIVNEKDIGEALVLGPQRHRSRRAQAFAKRSNQKKCKRNGGNNKKKKEKGGKRKKNNHPRQQAAK